MTLANAPLSARDVRTSAPDLPDGTSEIFFAEGMDTILAAPPVGQIRWLSSFLSLAGRVRRNPARLYERPRGRLERS